MATEVRTNVAPNGLRLVLANALQSSGDQTVNASTVLPWLLVALGAPTALIGLLVPIRESGSMLPQAFLTPLILRIRHRKWIFIAGALVQSATVAVMAGTAALGQGLVAGLVIVIALAVFSLGRCLCSIASKDVQGRTIPKGERGQINGLATTAAGVVALTLGIVLRMFGGENLDASQLAWVLATGAALWVLVAVTYVGVREPAGESTTIRGASGSDRTPSQSDRPAPRNANWFVQMLTLLRDDKPFRQFVTVRSLLLVSALSPPFVVALSIEVGADSLGGLGGFIIASGLSALIGGRIFGRFADRSSKRLMSAGAGVASALVLATVLIVTLPGVGGAVWINLLFIAVYFALTLVHTGVRVGRKTYVVDMAEGDQRTIYVAVSNSALGVILLIVGGISSLLAVVGVVWALVFLAVLGLVGVVAGARLPDVSRR